MVEAEWSYIKDSALLLDQKEIDRVRAQFAPPEYDKDAAADSTFDEHLASNPAFAAWVDRNVKTHKVDGYRAVVVSLKAPTIAPGDVTDVQMDRLADLIDEYSFSEIVTTHDQNFIMPHVKQADLFPLWESLAEHGLATPNIGLLTDMICCPGLDFCSLANAGSIPIAKQINEKFNDMDYLYDIGDIKIKMSGCMNACGHHHVGHIGIQSDCIWCVMKQVKSDSRCSSVAALVVRPSLAKSFVSFLKRNICFPTWKPSCVSIIVLAGETINTRQESRFW